MLASGFRRPFRLFLRLMLIVIAIGCSAILPDHSRAGDTEFLGSLDGELVPNTEDLDQIIFRPLRDLSKVKFASPPPTDASITAGRLYDPLRDKSAILALLVLEEGEQPFLYADLDLDNVISDAERFPMKSQEFGSPYILQTIVQLPFKNALFKSYPIVVQYYKNVDLG
jgi:hypothetical protein